MSVPVVRVAGEPHHRGRAAGAALAEPIHRSLAFYRSVLERGGVSAVELPTLLGPYREAAEAALPALMDELTGMAGGAGVSWWELFAVNAFEELEPSLRAPMERCTAFAVSGPGGTILGHNEQWYAGDAGNVAVVASRPDGGPGFVSPTVAACLPAVGMNGAGLAQAIMSLTAEDDGVGVPRVLVSRHALGSRDLVEGARRAAPAGRAGGYAHLFAEAGGRTAVVETSSSRQVELTRERAHTNHYLDGRLAAFAPPASPGSAARLERLRELLDERRPSDPDAAMEVLRDHESRPQPICLHADGDHADAEAVVFSMVCHLERRRMWVAPGNPCETPFSEIDLEEVA